MVDDFQKILKERFDYGPDGLYRKNNKRKGIAHHSLGKRAGALRPDGYRQISVGINGKRKIYLEHRLCFYYMEGRWPNEIDHIDKNKSNNAWSNLRECTRAQNNWNKSNGKNIRKSCQKWVAEIKVNHDYFYLGRFDTYEEALNARLNAERKYYI